MTAVLLYCLVPNTAGAEFRRRRVVFGRPRIVRVVRRQANNNNNFVNANQNINVNNLQEITGFPRLKNNGGSIVELNTAGQVRPLFIDGRTGQLLGATDRNTATNLKNFYLATLDQFKGGALNLVRRFLAAQGAGRELGGGIQIDLANSVVSTSQKYKGSTDQVKLATLNFLLNTISQSKALLRVQPQNVRGGQVGLNLANFMRGEALALLTTGYPYACGGAGSAPFRLDYLVSRAMSPDIYYQLIGAPRNLNQLASQLGTQTQKRATAGNKILIAGTPGDPESIVGKHPQRILEVQNEGNVPGGALYTSYDNPNDLTGFEAQGADATQHGVDTTFAAGEMIFHKPNGFLGFYLANAAGARAPSAPNEIASSQGFAAGLSDRAGHSNNVSAPANCLVCHATGFLGGGQRVNSDKNYTDNKGKIPAFSQAFFTSNAQYRARADRDSRLFKNSLINSGSFVESASPVIRNKDNTPAAPLLPDMTGAYNKDLTVAEAANELKVPVDRLSGLLRTNANGKIARVDFEKAFCSLKAQTGGGGAGLLAGAQNPIGSAGLIRSLTSTGGASHAADGSDIASAGGRRFAQ